MRIILLTKTPQSERTRLCLRLLAGSANAVVYLAGDGVYNLLGQNEPDCASQAASQMGKALWALLPMNKIMACRDIQHTEIGNEIYHNRYIVSV